MEETIDKDLLLKIDKLTVNQLILLVKYSFYKMKDIEENIERNKKAESVLCEMKVKKLKLLDSNKKGWFKVENICK